MRRLSIFQKFRLMRRAAKADRRRYRRKMRIEEFLQGHLFQSAAEAQAANTQYGVHRVSVYNRGEVHESLAAARTEMPKNFCLVENYNEVAPFILDLRHRLNTSGKLYIRSKMYSGSSQARRHDRITIDNYSDFSTMRRISPSAALVLAAEYERARQVFKAKGWLRAINLENWNPDVAMTLKDVGFLSLLDVEQPVEEVSLRSGVITVPFISGNKVSGELIMRLIGLLASAADRGGGSDSAASLKRVRVYDGLGEAVQNVNDHAYPSGVRPFGVLNNWWISGSVEPDKNRFTLVIYDQGVTIPVSLPKWNLFGDFNAAFAKKLGFKYDPKTHEMDGQAIAAAVEFGKTSTGEPQRGKGLPVIRHIVDNAEGGTLRIYSRHGQYVYEKNQSPKVSFNSVAISGTLIEWNLFL